MPLNKKGEEILAAMIRQYGKEKGERVFYASVNKGTITGVDSAPTEDQMATRDEEAPTVGAETQENLKETPAGGSVGQTATAPERPDRPLASPPERPSRPGASPPQGARPVTVPTYSPGFVNPTADTAQSRQVAPSNASINAANRARWGS